MHNRRIWLLVFAKTPTFVKIASEASFYDVVLGLLLPAGT